MSGHLTPDEIRTTIGAFSRWHYEFDLDGIRTPIHDPTWVNRHRQRHDYFFRPLVELCGGSLAGKRVLGLGCNAGFWSLCALENGCDFVLGVDGRQMHVDQAAFVFRAKGVTRSRYELIAGNVFDVLGRDIGPFDVVLCLRLLYHVSKPVALLEAISRINGDLLVVDTTLSTRHGSVFEVRSETLDEPRNAVDYTRVLWPTRAALLDIVQAMGYRAVVLQPGFTDYTGAEDYRAGQRRAFLCAKRTDLACVPGETAPLQGSVEGVLAEAGGMDLVPWI